MTTTTIAKLVRWQVKHLAACLYACRQEALIDDQPDSSTSTDEVANQKMVFDPIGESSRQKLRRKKQQDQERAFSDENSNSRSSKRSESSMLSFSEEEYIVFCFTDDGEIQIVKDKSWSSESSHSQIKHERRRSRSVNQTTQIFGENGEETSKPSHVVGHSTTALSDDHDGEEGSNDVKVEPHAAEIKGVNQNGRRESRTLHSILSTAESSDSNQSDASTGSFAFPILRREWTDSPVHMPKPEDIRLRKHKARLVRLNCCRF